MGFLPSVVAATVGGGGGPEPGGPIEAANVVQTNQPAPGTVCYSNGTYLFNPAGSTEPPDATFRDTGIPVGSIHHFTSGSGGNLGLAIDQTGLADNDGSFRNVRITGQFSTGQQSLTYNRADRFTYNPAYGNLQTLWAWNEQVHLLVGGQRYEIEFDVGDPVPDFHTLTAAPFGPTFGFVGVQGTGQVGEFQPRNSDGWPVGRLTYGGAANAVTFSFRGNRANTAASWVELVVTGQFQNSGQSTKRLLRTNANYNGYNATTDETAWGLPEFTDSFISGQTYEVQILNRTPGG